MAQYRVKLKRVVFAEVLMEADTVKAAREMVDADPLDWVVVSNEIGTDTATVVSVKLSSNIMPKCLV